MLVSQKGSKGPPPPGGLDVEIAAPGHVRVVYQGAVQHGHGRGEGSHPDLSVGQETLQVLLSLQELVRIAVQGPAEIQCPERTEELDGIPVRFFQG